MFVPCVSVCVCVYVYMCVRVCLCLATLFIAQSLPSTPLYGVCACVYVCLCVCAYPVCMSILCVCLFCVYVYPVCMSILCACLSCVYMYMCVPFPPFLTHTPRVRNRHGTALYCPSNGNGPPQQQVWNNGVLLDSKAAAL